jgi:glutaconyl-CoA decarboxylase
MKNYKIVVNGKEYEVGVEEIGGNAAPSSSPAVRPAAPAPSAAAPAPAAPKPAASAAPAGSGTVTAPLPGTVLKVNVRAGDKVARGDTLLILEAMKMENEISAPVDGTVAEVKASQGASVESGEVLIVIS